MVMFNPRLASGDVGVGLSVRAWSTGVLLGPIALAVHCAAAAIRAQWRSLP